MTNRYGGSTIAVTARGKVEYQLLGDAGPLLVGIHGSPGSCFQMSVFLDRLGINGGCCRRLTFSRPGYGGTPLSSGPSLVEQSDLLAALLDTLGLDEPATVFGFSAGGVSALEFALRYPERAARLVLLSPVTGSYAMYGDRFMERLVNRFFFSAIVMRTASWLSVRHPRPALRFLLMHMSHVRGPRLALALKRLETNSEDRAFLLDILPSSIPAGYLGDGIWNDDRNVLAADVSRYRDLKQPILIMHGEQDADVAIEQSEQLHEILPESSELIRVRSGGHLLLLGTQLEQLRRRIAAFSGVCL